MTRCIPAGQEGSALRWSHASDDTRPSDRLPSWPRLLPWLIPGLLLALYYDLSAWRVIGALGFPLDDSWIHAQFARNLATGHGFTYTGSRWVAGSTSPAWTILLAMAFFFLRSALLAGKALGLALQLVAGIFAARLVWHLTGVRLLALAGGLVVVVTPVVTWGAVSGMEVPLACVLVLAGFHSYLTSTTEERRALTGIGLLAAACLTRPECLVILGMVLLHFLVRSAGSRRLVRSAVSAFLLILIVLGPFVAFDFITTGRPLPTTFYAKSGPGLVRALAAGDWSLVGRLFTTSGPDAVWQFGLTLFEQYGVVAFLLGIGAVAAFARPLRRQGAGLIVLAVLAGVFGMGLVAPQRLKPENVRYTAQFVTLFALVGISAVVLLGRFVASRAAVAVAVSLVAGVTMVQSVRGAATYALAVGNIQELHVAMAGWLRDRLPDGTTIAANDVGAIAYFGGHPVVDLVGLVSPDSLAFPKETRGLDAVRATRPDYVVIFPGWYPGIADHPDEFREVYRVAIAHNYVAAGNVLVVYSTPWTRHAPLPRPSSAGRPRWPA